MPDFSSKITECYDALTRSQKTVADYYLEMDHAEIFAFGTLEDIAMDIGVSTTTIIRFARQLGYNGYSDMQKAIQNSLMDKVSLPERLIPSTGKIEQDQLLMNTMQNDISDITTTLTNISQTDLSKAVEEISSARRVIVLGMRSSFALAHYTTSRMGQIRPNVRLVQSAGMIYPEELIGCNEQDVCIAFLFPRYSKTAANLILWLRKRGVRIVLFTSNNFKAIRNYGDIFLPCSVGGISFKNSFVAPLCLINYIAAAIVALDHPRAVETLQQTEEFLNKGYHLGL